MAKKSKDDFLTQAIETAVSMAAQSTERIADLLPTDLFTAPATPQQPMGDMQQAGNPIQDWLDSYNDTEPDFEEVGI